MSIGVPIKVLHEAEGHIVTCETTTGEVYRGKLVEAEDNMNCQMANINVTYRDGRVAQLENVYIRGSKIRFLILPDMLKNAPMFKRVQGRGGGGGGGGAGRGKSAILRAQGNLAPGPYTKICTSLRMVTRTFMPEPLCLTRDSFLGGSCIRWDRTEKDGTKFCGPRKMLQTSNN